MSLAAAIAAWGGRSVPELAEVYAQHAAAPDFYEQLLDLLSDTDLQRGASWLLKHHLEAGVALSDEQQRRLFRELPQLDHWQTRIHLLQSLPRLSVALADRGVLEQFVRCALADHNKFLRAWAYQGFFELAREYAEFRDEYRQLVEMSLRDEAPSVKARLRQLAKQHF